MLETARKLIDKALKTTKVKPCLLWSGGLDSSLVLSLVKEFAPDIEAVLFKQDATQLKEIEALIGDTEVLSYPPAHRYFVPNGENEVSLVDEYSFGSFGLPLIRDFIHLDDRCSLEISEKRLEYFNFEYDTVFTGILGTDSHFATGLSPFGKDEIRTIDGIRFVSPLMNWSKEEVFAMAEKLGVSYVPDTDIHACTNCLRGISWCPKAKKDIDLVEWDRSAMIDAFREKFNIGVK